MVSLGQTTDFGGGAVYRTRGRRRLAGAVGYSRKAPDGGIDDGVGVVHDSIRRG